jgi:hypothetical protein
MPLQLGLKFLLGVLHPRRKNGSVSPNLLAFMLFALQYKFKKPGFHKVTWFFDLPIFINFYLSSLSSISNDISYRR